MFKASDAAVNSVSWGPIKLEVKEKGQQNPNSILISGGHDKSVKVWNLGINLHELT